MPSDEGDLAECALPTDASPSPLGDDSIFDVHDGCAAITELDMGDDGDISEATRTESHGVPLLSSAAEVYTELRSPSLRGPPFFTDQPTRKRGRRSAYELRLAAVAAARHGDAAGDVAVALAPTDECGLAKPSLL